MKAITLVKNGAAASAFEIRDKKTPLPGKGEVVVKVDAFGLNYADVMARNGLYKDAPPLPSVLGYEAVGTIHQVGEGVTSFYTGQKVLAFTRFGAYAEYCIADERALVELPETISNGEAVALATQYCTAYFSAYNMGNIQEGEKILVHAAAGGVGTAVIQLAKLRGCEIYGTAGSEEKIDYLKKLGVDHPINYRSSDFSEVIRDEIDVIFDPIGGSSFKRGKKMLAQGGRILCYGGAERSGGGLVSTLKFVWNFGFFTPIALLMKSQGIIGINMLRIADNKPLVLQKTMQNVVQLYKDGKIKPHIGASFKSEEIGKAHAFLESRKSIGKIVVEW
jgi:NADPH:quinone reductase-like Zn-dependent oxidoreductase